MSLTTGYYFGANVNATSYLDGFYRHQELLDKIKNHKWDNEYISKLPQDVIDSLPYNGYNDDIELDKDAPF